MSEYIDREKLLQALADRVRDSNNSDFVSAPNWNHAVDVVYKCPTADVMEIVSEYCQKRNLVIITKELYDEMGSRWSNERSPHV